MKVAHWTDYPSSGMNYFATILSAAEKAAGVDSTLYNVRALTKEQEDAATACDIHVAHTHLPACIFRRGRTPITVYMAVTPPESFFHTAIAHSTQGYGFNDPWMTFMHALRTSDAIVTFNDRYTSMIRSMSDKRTKVMQTVTGIDKSFWKPVPCQGKFSGNPSLLWAETAMAPDQYQFKSPFDLLVTWPLVTNRVSGAPCLHLIGIKHQVHRYIFPLVNSNDCSYTSHIWPQSFEPERLRATFCAVDYQIGLVDYGDTNMLSMQANACGCKSISFRGNKYADFWLTETEQNVMADELVAILNGTTPPRQKLPVPDISETAAAMKELYASL